VRARFSPEKLADFINDPKIFGISLNDEEKGQAGDKALGHGAKASDPDKADTDNDRGLEDKKP
jgi:hypothetical protein